MRPWRRRRIAITLALLSIAAALVGWRGLAAWRRQRAFDRAAARVRAWDGHLARAVVLPGPLQRLRGSVDDRALDLFRPFGRDFGNALSAWGSRATAGQLAEALAGEPLTQVWAPGASNLGDDWVAGLREPSRMRSLHLDATRVTDRSIDKILAMDELFDLSLVDTAITDAGLDRLWALPRLSRLSIGAPSLRAVRLDEGRLVDADGRPAAVADGPLSVRGRVVIRRDFGRPGNVRVMVRPDGSEPSWRIIPYGWNAPLGGVGQLERASDERWTFDVPVGRLPPGKARVEVWVDLRRPAPPVATFWRVGPFPVDLKPPGAGSDDGSPVDR